MKRLLLISALTVCAVLPARSARAQGTDMNTLTVTANVLGICTIDPATLDFGDYDPVGGDWDGSGTITVNCTQGSQYWIGLDEGANSPDGSARRMANGSGEFLSYELYRDAPGGAVWDNTDGGLGSTLANTVAAGYSAYVVTVHGRIPGTQPVSTGVYTDSVTMTVNF